MGADNIERFDCWKEYEAILAHYPIYVYPRSGYSIEKLADKVIFLDDAPLFDYSGTDVRKALADGRTIDDMVCPEVAQYIKNNKIW